MILEPYYKFETETKEVKIPRRTYKNPQLQRLANRWYGMDLVGMRLRVTAKPIKSDIQILFDPLPVWNTHFDSRFNPDVQISVKTKRIKLEQYDFGLEIPIDVWRANQSECVNMALKSIKSAFERAEKAIEKEMKQGFVL